MERIVMPDSMKEELKIWLDPVGKGSDEDIAQMEHWLNENTGGLARSAINVYWCKEGHDTVTIDRYYHGHAKTIICPYCHQESRSLYYMVDQSQAPHSEFYKPKDILAFPRQQQEALRRGAAAFKAILSNEPKRLSTGLLSKLSRPKQKDSPSIVDQVVDRLKPNIK
ncbi:hypothetical protein [Spirosoma aerophilum]